MKIVIAPDSFKGSLSSIEVIEAIKGEAEKEFFDIEVIGVPLADGGEGTIDAILFGASGIKGTFSVCDPLGNGIDAEYGIIGETAIVEMAQCSGLPLIPESQRNPMKTTSYGTGQMLKHILDLGKRDILIGIGGSATNDGGMGAMQALGARFYDSHNNLIISGCGENLSKVNRIDLEEFDKRIYECKISVMCDVVNPLTGTNGATYTYGRQKGATDEMLDTLEMGMLNFEKIINQLYKSKISQISGAGAAGGMGAALVVFCGAKLVSGIDAILKLKNFGETIKGADFIITGEGRVDEQSAYGKVIQGISVYATKQNIPVIVIAGGMIEGFEKVYEFGVKAIFSIANRPMSLVECMQSSKELIRNASRNIFALYHLKSIEV
ncbi:MAG: glycerate kinase [Eubacteriales bacterium]